MEQEVLQRQVRDFAEIPIELLTHIDKMGIDSFLILNEYEGRYLNYVFKTDNLNLNLVGKTVGFLGSKQTSLKTSENGFTIIPHLSVAQYCIFLLPSKKWKAADTM